MKKNRSLNLLRTITFLVVLGGAMGSIGLVFQAGRNNDSVLLQLLFIIWVLSPFIALLVVNRNAKYWADFTTVTLYVLMLFISVGSLISYSGIVSIPDTKPAFVFLIVPLVSWVVMGIVILLAFILSRSSNEG